MLDALADLGTPAPSRTLRAFVTACYGREVSSNQFGTLAVQERRAFARGGSAARPVWLSSGVTTPDFRPVKRIWTRSDWPLERRIMAPTTSRVQHLHLTEVLCALAMRADDVAQGPEALRALALAHARDLPGTVIHEDHPSFSQYAETARALLEQYEPEDRSLREQAAAVLATLPIEVQLFGAESRDGESRLDNSNSR
jgi:hypothetical protein